MLVLYYREQEAITFYDNIGTVMLGLLVLNIVFNFFSSFISFVKVLFTALLHLCKKHSQQRVKDKYKPPSRSILPGIKESHFRT